MKLGTSELDVSRIGIGCMRFADKSVNEVVDIIEAAVAAGYTFFDHADIYGGGKSEILFGEALKKSSVNREDIVIQSKCAIRPDQKTYDFSKEHILTAVDGILKRLQINYLDVLVLHRPDALFIGEEVAEAFDILEASGKVKHFGVSNQNPLQIELLKKYVKQPLLVNQVQFSIMHTGMIDSGINVNTTFDGAVNRDGGIIEYARLHDMTLQAWSPFMFGFFEGVFVDNDKFPELNKELKALAEKYEATTSAVAINWILRHPAKIQPIVGSANPTRITEISKAATFEMTRQEWYAIYQAAGNMLP